jgi:hypothetical protein
MAKEKVAFKYRIIAQRRVYLCMNYTDFEGGGSDVRALGVIRERDSGGVPVSVMPWVIFKGNVVIEPIVSQPDAIAEALECACAQPTSEEWARSLLDDMSDEELAADLQKQLARSGENALCAVVGKRG